MVQYCQIFKGKRSSLLYRHLQRHKVNVIKITPSYFRQLKEFIGDHHQLNDLRWIVLVVSHCWQATLGMIENF